MPGQTALERRRKSPHLKTVTNRNLHTDRPTGSAKADQGPPLSETSQLANAGQAASVDSQGATMELRGNEGTASLQLFSQRDT